MLPVDEEILKLMRYCLEQLKDEGICIPYSPLWSKLRALYDIPRKRVHRVVQFIKDNVSVTKMRMIQNDYDIWTPV